MLLGARSWPATLGTHRSSVLPWWSNLATSHRCAIRLLHAVRIRVLILGGASGVLIRACQTTSASFQTSLTLLQDSFFIFQQARGLSGHTSPCGECACSHLEATPGDWLPAWLVFYFLTLAPCDYVTYCQARGLAVGVWPSVPTRQDMGHTIRGGLAHKIKACTASYCILPNKMLSL